MIQVLSNAVVENIKNGETDIALQELNDFFLSNKHLCEKHKKLKKLNDELVLINSRFNTMINNSIAGLINNANVERLNIEKSILFFVDQLKSLYETKNDDSYSSMTVEIKSDEVELIIKKDFNSFSKEEQLQLLKTIGLLLKIESGDLRVVDIIEGSVMLRLKVPANKSAELIDIVKRGLLEDFDVIFARLISTNINYPKLTVIHPDAKIGKNINIGPFTVIEEDVVIGDNCQIGSNVHIFNGARIGDNVHIFNGASVSVTPQTKISLEEATTLEIGNGTVIREFCTLNRGNKNFGGRTIIGENCLLMAYVHVAHDCIIGNNVILANNVTLAGNIEIGDWATLGGMVAVHQFVRIGEQTMIGGGSLIRKDVPPFVVAAREPLSYAGINTIGLRRRGFTTAEMHHIEDIYRALFVYGLSTRNALKIIEEEIGPSPYRDQIITFVRGATRGLMKGFRALSSSGGIVEPTKHIE